MVGYLHSPGLFVGEKQCSVVVEEIRCLFRDLRLDTEDYPGLYELLKTIDFNSNQINF